MSWLLVAADCGVVRIDAALRGVSMTPTVTIAGWEYSVIVAVAVDVAVVVSTGGGCDFNKDCGCEGSYGVT